MTSVAFGVGGRTVPRPRRSVPSVTGCRVAGFSLVEVLVALVVLEIGLLGVLGLGVLAARDLARAASVQRAAGALDVVADSLLRVGERGEGERRVGAHRVRWRYAKGALEMEALPAEGTSAPLVRVTLPVGP